jgi:hypothetical protein
MRGGSKVIKLPEGIKTRAAVFRLGGGGREAPITNAGEGGRDAEAFPEPYDKRRPVETKYSRVKEKPENLSGRPAGNVKQDFYAATTVSDMLSGGLRVADEKTAKGKTKKRGASACAGSLADVREFYLINDILTTVRCQENFLVVDYFQYLMEESQPEQPRRGCNAVVTEFGKLKPTA